MACRLYKMPKGSGQGNGGGWSSTTGNPSGGGRSNAPSGGGGRSGKQH